MRLLIRVVSLALLGLLRLSIRLLPRLIVLALFLIQTMILSASCLWIPLPTLVSRMSTHWLEESVEWGLPVQLHPFIYSIYSALAFVMIVLGWILLAIIAALTIRHIFLQLL